MHGEIPRYQPYSDDPAILLIQAESLKQAFLNNNLPDNLVRVPTCSGYTVLPRNAVFLKMVDNFLALKDKDFEREARAIYEPIIDPLDTQPINIFTAVPSDHSDLSAFSALYGSDPDIDYRV